MLRWQLSSRVHCASVEKFLAQTHTQSILWQSKQLAHSILHTWPLVGLTPWWGWFKVKQTTTSQKAVIHIYKEIYWWSSVPDTVKHELGTCHACLTLQRRSIHTSRGAIWCDETQGLCKQGQKWRIDWHGMTIIVMPCQSIWTTIILWENNN